MVGGCVDHILPETVSLAQCKATWKRELKLSWREAGPQNHLDDKVDSDQLGVNKELSLSLDFRHIRVTRYNTSRQVHHHPLSKTGRGEVLVHHWVS